MMARRVGKRETTMVVYDMIGEDARVRRRSR